jgi:hypothetical protein
MEQSLVSLAIQQSSSDWVYHCTFHKHRNLIVLICEDIFMMDLNQI